MILHSICGIILNGLWILNSFVQKLMSEEDFRHYVDTYLYTTDNQERNTANQNLLNLLVYQPESFCNFLDYSINLFLDPKSKIQEQKFASVLMEHALKEKRGFTHKMLLNLWFNDFTLKYHSKIKGAFMRGLSHPDISIRNMCSKGISDIVLIENDWKKYFSLCAQIFAEISKPGISPAYFSGLVRAISDIFSCRILKKTYLKVTEQQQGLFHVFPKNLGNTIVNQNLPLSIRIDAANASYQLLNWAPNVYSPDIVIGYLNIIQNSFPNSDVTLFHILVNFLSEIIFKFHDFLFNDQQILPKIFELIHLATINSQSSSRCVAINFWYDIAQFERKLGPECQSVCSIGSQSFVDLMLSELLNIPINDTDIEDTTVDILPHMYATDVLSEFYFFNSEFIYERLGFFCNEKIESQNWVEIHAAVLSILVLTSDPLNPNVYQFILSKINYLISFAEQNDCPRLKETTLWTLSKCIHKYGDLVKEENNFERLFTLCEQNIPLKGIIMKRACQILNNIFRYNDNELNEQYTDRFLNMIFENISQNENDIFVSHLFDALNSFIKNTTENITEAIIKIIEQYKVNIVNSNIYIKGSICQSMMIITRKLGPQIMNDYCEFFINSFVSFLNSNELFGDSLLGISALIQVCQYNVANYSNHILQILISSLDSNNSTLLFIIFEVIIDIFQYIPQSIKELSDNVVISLLNFINISNEKNLIPSIIISLSLVLGNNYLYVQQQNLNAAIEFFDNLTKVKIEKFDENIDLQEDFVCAVIHGYTNIFNGFKENIDFLLQRKRFILEFLAQISFKGIFNDRILKEIYFLIKNMGRALNTRVNAELHRKYIQKLVEVGIEQENNEELHNEAQYIRDFIDDL